MNDQLLAYRADMARPDDKAKFQQFIGHLLQSPGIRNENILVGENMIYNFIAQNKDQLRLTLQGQGYFPHLSPEEALQSLVAELYAKVSSQTLEPVYAFLEEANFDFLSELPDSVRCPSAFHRDTLKSFITVLFKNREVRSNFASIYNIYQFQVIEKYLSQIFSRRDYLYNELVRVQKTYLEVDDYITYMKILFLVKNTVYMKVPLSESEPDRKYSLSDSMKMPGKIIQYMTMLRKELKPVVPNLNEKTISLAVKSNLNEGMTEIEDASSRFMYILSARYHNYKPLGKVDRGAEAPDKSWFAVAKKNSRLFGFDKNMLEELYRIAGDNNW